MHHPEQDKGVTPADGDAPRRRRATEDYLHRALYSPIPWPGKHIRLKHDMLLDAREQYVSPDTNLAELFHENSKLFPEMMLEISNRELDIELFRDLVVKRHNDMLRTHAPIELEASAIWPSVLSRYGQTFSADPLSVDLRVAFDGVLAAFDSGSCVLRVVKRFQASESERIRELSHVNLQHELGFLFIVGLFARSSMLYGVRGYRRALLAAGLVAGDLIRVAQSLGYTLVPIFDFVDRSLDTFLDLDGVEQGTLMMLGVADDE